MANRKTFSQEDHWDLRKEESSEGITHNLNYAFESNKHKKNPLIKAIYTTNKVIFFKIIILSLIRSCFDYTGPFLINRIIDYTSDPNRKFSTGVFIVLGLVVARVMWSIIAARLRTFFALFAIRTSNAVNGVIYQKILRFSLIRSVDHNAGSLVNHIQVDSESLNYTAWSLVNVVTLPVVLGIGIYLMCVAVGTSFFSGMGVIVVMSLVNFVFSKMYYK